MGTYGYAAPEYVATGNPRPKAHFITGTRWLARELTLMTYNNGSQPLTAPKYYVLSHNSISYSYFNFLQVLYLVTIRLIWY